MRAVKVPQNAYLDDSFDSGWRCDQGYREARDQCVAVEIPSNAHSVDSSYGQGWECDRGFQASQHARSHRHTGEGVLVALRTQLGM
jgi:hypothetical protein